MSTSSQQLIFKILSKDEWEHATTTGGGVFKGSPIDLQDGFIHFSAADQVVPTATKWFAGVANLLLVAVDTTQLDDGALLKWEVSRDGALFPHLYGHLKCSSAKWVKELPLGANGQHEFPDLL